MNKLEIFMLNVLRFREDPDIRVMVEGEGAAGEVIDRKIIRD